MEQIAFLGTRQPRLLPPHVVDLYRTAAASLGGQGDLLLSGATPGAEQLAAEAALAAGGAAEFFLPWALYEREWVARMERTYGDRVRTVVFEVSTYPQWLEAARNAHPDGQRLSVGSLAVHARCFGMIERATLVIVMPYVRIAWQVVERPGLFGRKRITGESRVRERTTDKGGTELAIRFAESLGVAAYDLSRDDDRYRLADLLEPDAASAVPELRAG
ncbi:MAG: hypothetical protein K0Q72_370 [Armatimonadetes bacterium]|jgi:hypothetical protein|nr:hypothetical protein [Armatimonadota bacterium]